ncbi:MAG: BACON domain-containing carbohydrate-binding protein [Rikenellaceae bacterium]
MRGYKFLVFFLAIAALLFVACVENSETDEVDSATPLTISSDYLNLETDADSAITKVSFSSLQPWSVTIDNSSKSLSWVEVSPQSGDAGEATITLSIEPNTLFEDRYAGIYISSGEQVEEITLCQLAAVESMEISTESCEVAAVGESFEVDVTANCQWSLGDLPEWISVDPLSGEGDATLLITCEPNELTDSREATLTFSAGELSRQLQISQAGAVPFVEIDKEEIVMKAEGESVSIDVISNYTWSIGDHPEWISVDIVSVDPSSGYNATMLITCEPNELTDSREATLVFSAGDSTAELKVSQIGADPFVSLSVTETSVDADGKSFSLDVTSNYKWSVGDLPEWISLDPSSGEGDATVVVSCEANGDTEKREATVVFTADQSSATLTITQIGSNPTIAIDYKTKSVSSIGEIFSLYVISNYIWSADNIPEWLTLDPSSGDGNAEITITCGVNESIESREASIIFTAGDDSETLVIEQEGAEQYIELSRYELSAASQGEEFTIDLSSNGEWTTTALPSWVSLTPTQGDGDKSLSIVCQENLSTSSREASITFATCDDSKELKIEQEGCDPIFDIDVNSLSVAASGNTFTINVTSNCEWSASNSLSWVTLTPSSGEGDSQVSVTCSEQTDVESRQGVVTFSAEGIERQLTIVQDAAEKTISLDIYSKSITYEKQSFNVTVTSNSNWTLQGVPSWMSVTLTSGSGSGSSNLSISCSKNDTSYERESTITFKTNDNSVELVVTQGVSVAMSLEAVDDPYPDQYDSFLRRVLGFQFTATWCGYCPNMIKIIHTFKSSEMGDLAYIVSAHGSDSMACDESYQLMTNFGITGFPTIMTGGLSSEDSFKNYYYEYCINQITANESASVISASSMVDSDNIYVRADVKVGRDATLGIGVMVLEDGIYAAQSNYFSSSELDLTGIDINTHNNVLRGASVSDSKMYTALGGVSENKKGETYTYNCQFDLSDLSIDNIDNCHIIVYTYDATSYSSSSAYSNYVDNVIDLPVGGSKAYEYDDQSALAPQKVQSTVNRFNISVEPIR